MSILSTPNEEDVYFNFINSLKSDVTKKTYEREIKKYFQYIHAFPKLDIKDGF